MLQRKSSDQSAFDIIKNKNVVFIFLGNWIFYMIAISCFVGLIYLYNKYDNDFDPINYHK